MIGWIEGLVRDCWQRGQRHGLLLVRHGVGYELAVSRRVHDQLTASQGETRAFFTHLLPREDSWQLFGFASVAERDLFRELIAVNGVGPQVAMGLLGTFNLEQLVQAVVQADISSLSQAPGVGKRTAERLAVELRRKLASRFGDGTAAMEPANLPDGCLPTTRQREDVELTLTALGYGSQDIQRALAVAGSSLEEEQRQDGDAWLRHCLAYLAERDIARGG